MARRTPLTHHERCRCRAVRGAARVLHVGAGEWGGVSESGGGDGGDGLVGDGADVVLEGRRAFGEAVVLRQDRAGAAEFHRAGVSAGLRGGARRAGAGGGTRPGAALSGRASLAGGEGGLLLPDGSAGALDGRV